CSQAGHDSDANYCKHCGTALADLDKRVVRGEG
ncbi:ion transporter, partial [Vibrio parahaemolyticus]